MLGAHGELIKRLESRASVGCGGGIRVRWHNCIRDESARQGCASWVPGRFAPRVQRAEEDLLAKHLSALDGGGWRDDVP